MSSDQSDLAPFVAALLRDNVLHDQIQTILRLKERLENSQRVEITGPYGTPVYASGSFAEGAFNTGGCGSLLWDVGLKMLPSNDGDTATTKMMPLKHLSNLEIRIGGTLYSTSSEVDKTSVSLGIRPGNKFDGGDMSRSAICTFGAEGRDARFTFHVRGLPRVHWNSLQRLAVVNRSVALRYQEREDDDDEEEWEEPLDMFKLIHHGLAKEFPDQKADITSVSFSVKSVRMAIANVSRGADFEKEKEEQFDILDELIAEEMEDH